MPELPETETIARDLHREITGRRITDVVVLKPDVLREVSALELTERLRGAQVTRCWRRAKLVVVDFDTTDRLVVQPRFTGALLLSRGPLPDAEAPYSTSSTTQRPRSSSCRPIGPARRSRLIAAPTIASTYRGISR